MYFENFKNIYYSFPVQGVDTLLIVKDITENIRVRKEVLANISLYDEYDISDGDTPEIISERIYGSPLYHWVVMIFNERYDYLADFPLSQAELDKYVTQKHGTNLYNIHHYEDSNGFVVNQNSIDIKNVLAVGITNRDYEYRLNENKRRIKIINPKLLPQILQEIGGLL